MAKSPNGVWLFLTCLLLVSCSQPSDASEAPQAINGQLDLRGWDFSQQGHVSLSGEWEFYWQELLTPFQVRKDSVPLFVSVPDTWTSYEVDGEPLPPQGFATYRLLVQLPASSQSYGLFIEGEGTAYTLWVDGEPLTWNGSVADNPQEMIPESRPQAVFFQPGGDTTEFVIQISNFNHRKAGFRNEVVLASSEQILEHWSSRMSREAAIMGVYLVMALYHIFIYIFRPANRSPLYFAIWSFLFFVRTGLLNQKILVTLLPVLTWETALRLEYLTFYMVSPIYALFIQSLYPRDVHDWMMRAVLGLGAGFSVFMFFIDTLSLSQTVTIYQVILLAEIAYFIYFIWRILALKREGALYIAAASAIGFTSVILEILSLQNIIPFEVDGTMSFLVFILIQAVMLSSILSKSFQRVEVLSNDLQEANTNLLTNERKYRTIFEDSKDMIFIAELDGRIRDANPSSEEILGYTQGELRQMKSADLLVHQADREKIEKILTSGADVRDHELELRRRDGSVIHGLLTLTVRRDETGRATDIQGNVHDISARIQAENERERAMEFEQLAISDPLTNIYNRRFFDEIAIKEWELARRTGSPLTIVLFDIDHFKQVNDTHGHLTGDIVLTHLADLCSSNIRSMDIFARYGGEEFVILMPDTDHVSAHRTMERIRTVLQETALAEIDGTHIFITISVGIAEMHGHQPMDLQALLDRADQALYSSKDAGRNRATIWNAPN